jgi:hypothetical protein
MPRRLGTATVGEAEVAAVRPPPAPSEDAIVFVHGSAARRATARLQALGVRGDSIESAIRRNDLCELAAWIDVRRGVRPGPAPEIDFAPRPGSPPRVVPVETGPGVFARVRADVDGVPVVSVACRTDVLGPDRVGTLELDPLLWAVEREGAIEGRAPLWARDLGPRDNARLIDAFSGRPAWVLVPDEEGVPRYEPYDAAMTRIWGVDVSAAGPAGRSP